MEHKLCRACLELGVRVELQIGDHIEVVSIKECESHHVPPTETLSFGD